ncbi:unnamed protein product [Didymodactylos carnosus]|uniref:Uncharacterized protein n=1 Tax=Didymodactylos carnosus TaxID=1234261 RepID=A0A814KRX2_9BILA|nr:unnamed protein product [Didymodactylos carnosus]CAF1055019.1 unnamed protein product [Didymodactylos carnosus]CAF3715955.1 unnamed protein product [Didymodactylos carnosus]CAF3824167.1 unnamed protein product [Didymodactylos carnosus]
MKFGYCVLCMIYNQHNPPQTPTQPNSSAAITDGMIIPENLVNLLRSNQIVLPLDNIITTERIIYKNNGVLIFQDFLAPSMIPIVVKNIPDYWLTKPNYHNTGSTYATCLRKTLEPPGYDLNPQLARYLVIPRGYHDTQAGFMVTLQPQQQLRCDLQTEVLMIIDTYMPRLLDVLGYDVLLPPTFNMFVVYEYLNRNEWFLIYDALSKYLMPSSDMLLKIFCNLIATACNMDDDLIYYNDLHLRNVMFNVHTGAIKIIDYGGFIVGQEKLDQMLQIYRQNGVHLPRLSNVYKLASTFDSLNKPIASTYLYQNQLNFLRIILEYEYHIAAGYVCAYLRKQIPHYQLPLTQAQELFQQAMHMYFKNMVQQHITPTKQRLVCH